MAHKFQMNKRILSVLLALVMLLTVLPMPSAQAAISRHNVTEYRSGDTYIAPVKADCVFAGWYTDIKLTKPLPKTTTTGMAYAKYVDRDVLGVKWQIKAGTTADSAKTDLRLLTSVDALTYKEVGFIVEADGKPIKELTSNTVYRTVYGYVNDGNEAYQPTIFSEDSQYFMVHTLTGIPQSDFDSKIKVTPKWITLDGTVVLGKPLTFKVSDAFPEEEEEKPVTELPKLYFEGQIRDMVDKSDARKVEVRYVVDGETVFEGFAELKIQGSSSAYHPQKNYTMKLYKDADHEKKLKVQVRDNWGEQSKYCLKANFIDRTHSRNIVTAQLAAEAQAMYGLFEDTPHNGTIEGFPIQIYNNGEILGLYTFNIPKDEWMFNMDGDDPNHIAIQGDENDVDSTFFKKLPDQYWTVEIGPENQESMDKFTDMARFIIESSDEEFKEHFDERIDLDSMLNYMVFLDVAHLFDNLGKNMLFVTYDGYKWYPTLYDLDTSWGGHWNGDTPKDYDQPNGEFVYRMENNQLFIRVKKNFGKELSERYFILRDSVLSDEHIKETFEDFRKQVPQEAYDWEKEYWGDNYRGAGFEQIMDYIDVAIPNVDARYHELYNSTH